MSEVVLPEGAALPELVVPKRKLSERDTVPAKIIPSTPSRRSPNEWRSGRWWKTSGSAGMRSGL